MNAIAKPAETAAAAPARTDSAALISVIERVAANPEIDIERMERLFAMHQQMQAAEAQRAYAAALSEMQARIPDIPKRGEIRVRGVLQSTYALWEDVNAAIRPLMQRFGFSISFRTAQDAGNITVMAVLAHRDGHSEQTSITLPHDTSGSKNAVQALGSSLSYGKRYTAGELLNITTRGEDDDGVAGGAQTITDEQAATIRRLVEETGSDMAKFLAYGGIERLEDMPQASFNDAHRMLKAKAAKQEAK